MQKVNILSQPEKIILRYPDIRQDDTNTPYAKQSKRI